MKEKIEGLQAENDKLKEDQVETEKRIQEVRLCCLDVFSTVHKIVLCKCFTCK